MLFTRHLLKLSLAVTFFVALPLQAQVEDSAAVNPLAQLKVQLNSVLEDAALPFTDEQEGDLTVMMDERLRASEDLFGDLMDFRAGPTQGDEADRLVSAIEWMRGEFLVRLENYLTPQQLDAWEQFVDLGGLEALDFDEGGSSDDANDQTQYVRINNNAFRAEEDRYRNGGGGTEVIQRGGAGAFHGRVEFQVNDDGLNARNPFASNKPPYQERETRFDVSGPLIRGLLTSSFGFRQNESENVSTVNATLADGSLFELGIVRPNIDRRFDTSNTFQLAEDHSLRIRYDRNSNRRENQGVGGFTLPERASTNEFNNWSLNFRQFSTLSSRRLYETSFNMWSSEGETNPVTEGVQINVLDAFRSGGAQNLSRDQTRNYNFNNLFTQLGEVWTLKAGSEVRYRTQNAFSEESFDGEFTFSSLDDFNAGNPSSFRINQGDPLLETSQWEFGFFAQNDLQLTPEFTLMLGVRYDRQTNLSDRNNFSPRLGYAWGIGRNTVLRGGIGVFHQAIDLWIIENQLRFDGTRQFEIVIDDPSYPDPFQAGTIEQTFPSVRVTSEDLAATYSVHGLLSLEKTFFTNLFVRASYDMMREIRRLRFRNLNAPLPDCVALLPASPTSDEVRNCRPDPTRGNIDHLESTAGELRHTFRFDYRQRFSIFQMSSGYTLSWAHADARARDHATDSYNLASDWSRNPIRLHSWDATVNARMPLGVFLSGVVRAESGSAYTVTTGTDDNRDGRFTDRPLGVPRFSEVGPGSWRADFNISKAFFFGGGSWNGGSPMNMNLFANMTNAFNSTILGTPSGVITSPNFGKSTSASDPREIEAGVRFQF